jgi:hypothetical protein
VDDGSEPSAAALANGYGAQQVWQPHAGFRAAAIRNKAARASSGEHLIFLDGGCVPRPSFVARHCRLAETGWSSPATGRTSLKARPRRS